jgi:tetratricopeptide (TPR) repeat protein
MYRFRQRVMIVVLFAVLAWMGAAQETPPPPQSPAPTHQDAPAPEPHPELKPLVEDIRTLLGNGKFQDALPKADELLQQAKAKSDKIGEAYALRFRAFALQEMRKTTPDQLPEVASVWASALALWREIGDEAYQVEALLGQAYCVWRASPEQAQALVAEALRVARGEAKRPLAVATALHNAGVDWYGIGQLSVVETLWQQALAIREQLAPNSLQVANTLNNLGNVAYNRGDLAAAEQLLQQALAIFEKLAPNSLQVASTLNNLGNVAYSRGDLAAAERYLSRRWRFLKNSPPTRCRWQPRSTIWACGLCSWLWRVRSSCFSRRWRFKNSPPTRWMWQLNNLGWVAYSRATWRVRSSCISRRWRFTKNSPPTRWRWQHAQQSGECGFNRGDLAACGTGTSAGVGDLRKTCPQLAAGGRHAQQSGECGSGRFSGGGTVTWRVRSSCISRRWRLKKNLPPTRCRCGRHAPQSGECGC